MDAFALPDGTAAAVKIDDGNPRARTPVTAAILALLGAQPPVELATSVVLGGGDPVGVIRATRLALSPRSDSRARVKPPVYAGVTRMLPA